MATNTGSRYRTGSVRNRTQVFNPRTLQWIKRDRITGQFLQAKKDGTPFKGVAKEQDRRRSR